MEVYDRGHENQVATDDSPFEFESRRAHIRIGILARRNSVDRDDKLTIAGPDLDVCEMIQRYLQSRGFREVEVARVDADTYWAGRVPDMRAEQQTLRIHGITIDLASREASIDGGVLDMKPRAWELLAFLATNAGIALHRDVILDRVWGVDADVFGRTVDTHIRWVRMALGDKADYLRTVKGVGYMMEKEDCDGEN